MTAAPSWISQRLQPLWGEAVRVHGELIDRDPSYENAFYHRACCRVELGRHGEAVADCRR